MELIKFTVNKKDVAIAEKQRKARRQSCHSKKAEYAAKFSIIQKLDNSLKKFQVSCYSNKFKRWIIQWVEDISANLYSDSTKFSDDDIKAFINNFGWYNSVITMLLANQVLIENDMFCLKNPETNRKLSPLMADVDFIIGILKICDKTFGQTINNVKMYKKRLSNYNRLKEAYNKFLKSTKKYVDNIHSKDRHQIGDLMFIEPYLTEMMETFKKDIIDTKPIVPEVFSNKRRDVNRALTIAVIKMFNKHATQYYKIKGEVKIYKLHNLLSIVGCSLLSILNNKKADYFTENEIKGILKKQ